VTQLGVRGKNYSADELNSTQSLIAGLLTIIEEQLPLGGNGWEQVAREYNRLIPPGWSPRDSKSLKGKFICLKNHKKPTGILIIITVRDPECPEDVKRAKWAQKDIDNKAL
jgi:hypothetical protein